ncbi:MAG TPA: lipopolysaccharide biosynthesis protein [Longimicrobiales bacterium]|nr:lipopolysaccharide biosynthesis protein [Longimicrobiales bacterium]
MLWNAAAKGGGQLVQFAATIALARLLVPDQFGLIAMVAVMTGFGALFTDIGLGAALVQHRPLREAHRSTVFWTTLVLGLILTLAVAAASPLVAAFYDEPVLTPLTRAMAAQFVLLSAGTTPRAILIRTLNFRAVAIVEIGSVAVGSVAAVALALAGAGVWALVAQILVAAAMGTILAFAFSRWVPRAPPEVLAARELFGFSSHLMGFNVTNYWARNADNLLVGRVLGSVPLGLYGVAYTLMYLPLQQIAAVVGQVVFPLLSELRTAPERGRRVLEATVQLITLATAPLLVLMAVTGSEIVSVLLGDGWERAGFLLRALAVGALPQVVVVSTGWIYQSQGRTDIMFRWGLLSSGVVVVAVLAGLRWGVEGVAVAQAIASWSLAAPALAIAGGLMEIRLRDFARLLASPAVALAVLAVVSGLVRAGLSTVVPAPGVLFGSLLLGGIVYALVVWRLRPWSVGLLLARLSRRGPE